MAEYTPLHEDEEQPSNNNQNSNQLPQYHHHQQRIPLPMSVVGKSKSSRVTSLDVFRGLCVFLMMVVDYGGAIIPEIAHAPWNGLHLADFVMPFFLFIAGVSLAIVYKKVADRMDATKKAVTRAAKLFLLGVFLQGGYLHGAKSLTYGVDILSIRWMGILQRISIGYIVAALCEIWLPCQKWRRFGIVKSYVWQWCVTFFLCSIYLGLLYGLYVPDWEVDISKSNSSVLSSNSSLVYKVKCGVRGDLGPACNSAGMIDRYVLGVNHLYAKPAYKNLKVSHSCCDMPYRTSVWAHSCTNTGSQGAVVQVVRAFNVHFCGWITPCLLGCSVE